MARRTHRVALSSSNRSPPIRKVQGQPVAPSGAPSSGLRARWDSFGVMARRGLSEAARQVAALQAGRRMIARGDRPAYRIRTAQDCRWRVDAMPWLSMTAQGGVRRWTRRARQSPNGSTCRMTHSTWRRERAGKLSSPIAGWPLAGPGSYRFRLGGQRCRLRPRVQPRGTGTVVAWRRRALGA